MDLGIGGLGHATEIGAGASAVVYRARQINLDREVAVKVLSATDEAFVRRFHREAMTLGKLSLNPGIVTVHGTGVTESGHPYLILELCQSSVLDRLKAEGKIAPAEACDIGAQVADAVSYAHANGVVHRDIKPGNLLQSQGGRYLITDFGIATVRGSTMGQTESIGFTAGYVAPETLRGEEAGNPADVYALGATLFHMLSGTPPFVDQTGNTNLLALAQRVINDPVPDLRFYGVPDDVARIVEGAMAKHTADRPDAAQLRDQLRAVADRSTVAITPDQTEAMASPPPVPFEATTQPGSERLPSAQPTQPVASHDGAEVAPSVGGGLLGGQGAAVPPGQIGYAPPPAGGGQPWALIFLSGLAALVLVLAAVSVAIGLSGDDDGDSVATDATPESPSTSAQASQQGSSDSDSGGRSGSLPEESTSTTAEESTEEPIEEQTTAAVVPDLTGKTESQARQILVNAGFAVVIQERDSTAVEPGLVAAQEPTPGREAAEGSVVVIFVAVEPEVETVTVPTVAGLTETDAVDALTERGLRVGTTIREFSQDPIGRVIRSTPTAGIAVEPNAVVTLVVSQGVEPPTCAELVDLSEAAATDRIEKAGLTVNVVRQESEAEPAGEVVTCEATGTAFNLVVSDGPDPCIAVIGRDVTAGIAALEKGGYSVTATGVVRPDLADGEIISCSTEDDAANLTFAQPLPTECPAEVIGETEAKAKELLEDIGFSQITVEGQSSDTVQQGQVLDCVVAAEAVTLVVSTGLAVQEGTLTVTVDRIVVEEDCGSEGLTPDLYGTMFVTYAGQQKVVFGRTRLQALTPDADGEIALDEALRWSRAVTGEELSIQWTLKDTDRGRGDDEDRLDDDVSMVNRTIELTGADRNWNPPSDANDLCTLQVRLSVEWTNLAPAP